MWLCPLSAKWILTETAQTKQDRPMGTPARSHDVVAALSEESVQTPTIAAGQRTSLYLGRNLLGLAAIGFSVISLIWHDFGAPWQQTVAYGNFPLRSLLLYLAVAAELFGGIAIQWPKTAQAGASVLGCVYLIFALLWVPRIAREPFVWDRWANFFEQLSIVSGALIIYGTAGQTGQRAAKVARLGCLCFGICVISFTLEQLFYLSGTASFVPKWIPPGQMFWAIATTIAFALAAVALLSGRLALLASRLMVAMILGFGLLVWLPRPFADPHALINWAGNAQNLAIAGAAWIVADFLGVESAG